MIFKTSLKQSRNAMFNKGDGMATLLFSLTPSKDFLTREHPGGYQFPSPTNIYIYIYKEILLYCLHKINQ